MDQLQEARQVMKDLMKLATATKDMKKFKNISAVYVIWQTHFEWLQRGFYA